jgi:outer membrane protein OmpA-like peptidoglycan-associated protein
MVVQTARGMCLAAALASVLGGCVAIDAYRSVRGLDQADPDPATAPYSKALAAGEAADYPNLATVPPPPTRASTAAERAALTKTLIAERVSAEADAGRLQAAVPAPAIPVPAARKTAANAAVPAPVSAPAPAATTATAEAAAPDAVATQPGSPARRRGRQPTEAPPLEATLQIPVLPSVPEPEATRPPPAPPRLAPAPAIGSNDLPAARAAVEVPAAPPPAPVIAPPAPVVAAAPEPKRAPPAASIAAFDLADPPSLGPDQRARLDQVAAAYRDRPGTVKIVAYAAPAPSGPEQLSSFRAALGRAQFVAAELAKAGIPSNKIQTEASPAGGGAAPGWIEVRLAP